MATVILEKDIHSLPVTHFFHFHRTRGFSVGCSTVGVFVQIRFICGTLVVYVCALIQLGIKVL